MNEERRYGEVKVRKNIFPKDARELVLKEDLSILMCQCKVSEKTKAILDEGNIKLYEGVEPDEVIKLREKIKELLKEKQENEKE